MSFTFAFGAVGDFIAVGSLIKDISQCLSDCNGSSKKYQSLIDSLGILGDAVGQVDLVFRDPQRARANKDLCLAALKSVKLVKDSLQVLKTRLRKFDFSLGIHESGNRFKDVGRKIQFMLREEEIEAAKREIMQSTIVLKLLLETMALHIVEHNHEAITRQLDLIGDQNHQTRRNIQTRGRALQDIAKKLGKQVLDKISFLTQTVLDVKRSMSQIAFAVFSIPTELASLRALLQRPQQSPSDEYFVMEDSLGRIFPIHLRTITSWDAFFFILCEKFKGERGARRVQRRLFKLLDNASRQEIAPDTRWERAFLPYQKVAMSLLCRGEEVSGANDCRLATCPRCQAQSSSSTSVQIQCQECNMYYTREIALDHAAPIIASTDLMERGRHNHSNSCGIKTQSTYDTRVDENISDESESDDEDISGLIRVTIVSKKKRNKKSQDAHRGYRSYPRGELRATLTQRSEPFCFNCGINFSTEDEVHKHRNDSINCETKQIYFWEDFQRHPRYDLAVWQAFASKSYSHYGGLPGGSNGPFYSDPSFFGSPFFWNFFLDFGVNSDKRVFNVFPGHEDELNMIWRDFIAGTACTPMYDLGR